jgi:hypothetical protein
MNQLKMSLEVERGSFKLRLDNNGVTLRRGEDLTYQFTWYQVLVGVQHLKRKRS